MSLHAVSKTCRRKCRRLFDYIQGIFFLVALFTVGIPEPFSLIMVIIAVLMNKFIVDVAAEKGSLRPAKIAKTVVKKG